MVTRYAKWIFIDGTRKHKLGQLDSVRTGAINHANWYQPLHKYIRRMYGITLVLLITWQYKQYQQCPKWRKEMGMKSKSIILMAELKRYHIIDDIFKLYFANDYHLIFIQISLPFVLVVILSIECHRVRWWLGTEQVTNHNLNQWWPVHWCIYASSVAPFTNWKPERYFFTEKWN